MSRVWTRTFVLLLYLEFIKNNPEEPFMLSIVKKMCTYRDSICKGEKVTICTTRFVNNKIEYKKFSSSCYLFLSNICDQPGNEYNIISEGSCLNTTRRKNYKHTEDSNEFDPEQRFHHKYNVKKKKKIKKDVRKDEIQGMDYENVDDDNDQESTRTRKETFKFNDKEASDGGKGNSNEDYYTEVTPMPIITLLDETRGEHSRYSSKYKKSSEKKFDPNDDVKVKKMLLALKKDIKKRVKSGKIKERGYKEEKKVIKKGKTTKYSRHTHDNHLEKHRHKNNIHKPTKNHHHHHHQHHEKTTAQKNKLRFKRHSVLKSKSHSYTHAHVRSHSEKSLLDNDEKSEEFKSVNADDNDDKTPEEVSIESSHDENISDSKINYRRSSRHNKKQNKKKDKNTPRESHENISIVNNYDNKDMEKIKDMERLNKSRFIVYEKVVNETDNALLVVGHNITIYDAKSLYKALTGNVSISGSISEKIKMSGTVPHFVTTDKDIVTDKSVKNDTKLSYNFTESPDKITKSINEAQMKANDNETDQIISHVSNENDRERNDKSGEEDQSTENITARGLNTDESISDRLSVNPKTRGPTNDKKENFKGDYINKKMLENTETTIDSIPSDYIDVENLDIEEKFHHDVREKLTELNLTAANIDQYNETLVDIAEFNRLIEAIDVINDGRRKNENLGPKEVKITHTAVETKPKDIMVERNIKTEQDMNLTEFVQDSIAHIIDDENIHINDNPALLGNFRRDIEMKWLDIQDMLWK